MALHVVTMVLLVLVFHILAPTAAFTSIGPALWVKRRGVAGFAVPVAGERHTPPVQTSSSLPLPPMPRHVAFIVDGNGRWAEQRGLDRREGHTAGANVTVDVVKGVFASGVDVVTLYLFSTENWQRPADEVANIFALLETYLQDFAGTYLSDNNIVLKVIGQTWRLPPSVQKVLSAVCTEAETGTGTGTGVGTDAGKAVSGWLGQQYNHFFGQTSPSPVPPPPPPPAPPAPSRQKVLCLALSYGGRADIVEATRQVAERCVRGDLKPEDVTDALFAQQTATGRHGLPDPDVIIRTSGEERLSNFLLWQGAYAELVFVDKLWPDFSAAEAVAAIAEAAARKRRFGGGVGNGAV